MQTTALARWQLQYIVGSSYGWMQLMAVQAASTWLIYLHWADANANNGGCNLSSIHYLYQRIRFEQWQKQPKYNAAAHIDGWNNDGGSK
jgi:hypothetical protein